MTAKFGFQVTVQDRTIWIFPEDVNSAAIAAQAEAAFKKMVAEQLATSVINTKEKLEILIVEKTNDPEPIKKIKLKVKDEIGKLVESATLKDKITVWVNNVSITEISEQIKSIKGKAEDQLASLQARASTGITYGWKRGVGEDPITLGTFKNLLDFIDNSIVHKLGLKFDVSDEFDNLVKGLPEPISGSVQALTDGAVFELDEIRLKIPGKGSTITVKNAKSSMVKPEPTQFEITMLINLLALDLELGPFQLNRIYAKLGNFGKAEAAELSSADGNVNPVTSNS